MASLADIIEQYLKQLLANSEDGTVDVQRNQLAETFGCAPSQISYVLATRFLLEHGYLVESRRGGGGYVRITVLQVDPEQDWNLIFDSIGEAISQHKAEALIAWLLRDGIVTEREAAMMKAVVSRDVLAVNLPWRDIIRANMLKAMLVAMRMSE